MKMLKLTFYLQISFQVYTLLCLSVYLSVYLSIHSVRLSLSFVSLSFCLSKTLEIKMLMLTLYLQSSFQVNTLLCLFVCLSIYLSVCPSIHSVRLFQSFVCLSLCLSKNQNSEAYTWPLDQLQGEYFTLSVCLFVYLSVCLSIYTSLPYMGQF